MKTIYIGGGTPSSLSVDELELLLKEVYPLVTSTSEFTMECNFENITKDKLLVLKKYGVNRLSFGVQSLNDDVLISLNRHHTHDDVIRTIKMAKSLGFNNISIDLIYGLPNVTKELFKKDLESFITLDIKHISTYSLMISPNTVFYLKGIQEVSDEVSREYYDIAYDFLEKNGYKRYEVSNFSLEGYESKHNQVYWNNEQYVGVGLGASGYLNDIRYSNTRSMNEYLKGNYILTKETVTHIDKINYFLMLKLRMVKGFNLNELKTLCTNEEYDELLKRINNISKKELLKVENNNVRCSKDGLMLLDMILRDLFLDN